MTEVCSFTVIVFISVFLTIINQLEAPTQQAFTDDSLVKAISRTSL